MKKTNHNNSNNADHLSCERGFTAKIFTQITLMQNDNRRRFSPAAIRCALQSTSLVAASDNQPFKIFRSISQAAFFVTFCLNNKTPFIMYKPAFMRTALLLIGKKPSKTVATFVYDNSWNFPYKWSDEVHSSRC